MLRHVGLGIALMFATTFVHTSCTALLLAALRALGERFRNALSVPRASLVVAGVVVLLFLAALVEAALWAMAYRWLDALPSFEQALYFSVVTFTTLGFGDVTLSERWQLLSAFEAANGIILFGWSTALVFAVVQRLALGKPASRHGT